VFIRGEGAEELAIHLIAGISGGLSLGARTPPGFDAREAADAVFAAMGPLERALVAGCVLDADVSNGGHEQLMFNPSGDLAEAALVAFEDAAMTEHAAAVETFVALFGAAERERLFPPPAQAWDVWRTLEPSPQRFARQQALTHPGAWWDGLDDLDRHWWSLERVEDRLGPALEAAGAYERWAEHPGG